MQATSFWKHNTIPMMQWQSWYISTIKYCYFIIEMLVIFPEKVSNMPIDRQFDTACENTSVLWAIKENENINQV